MKEQIDLDISKVLGLDIEEEDRDVGIFGRQYAFILQDANLENKQYCLYLYEDALNSLIRTLVTAGLVEEKKEEW